MNKNQIKKLFSKVSLFALCTFSLPFLVYGSSFEMPKRVETARYSRGETGHVETDQIFEKIVHQKGISLTSRLSETLSASVFELSQKVIPIMFQNLVFPF